MATLEAREHLQVGSLASSIIPPRGPEPEDAEDEVVIDLRTQSVIGKGSESNQVGDQNDSQSQPLGNYIHTVTGSASSSTRASSRSSG